MKKILFVFMIVAGFTQADAQSMLRVHVADNTLINVALDGRYFNKRGTGITVGDLPPGRHFVQIYAANQDRRGRLFQDVIYEGKVRTMDGMVTLLEYDPVSGEAGLQQEEISAFTKDHPIPASSQPQDQGGNNDGNYNNGNDTPPVSKDKPATLTDSKIDMLKTQVAAMNTDTEKMKALKDALQSEQVATSQVGAMMDWFEFESSKESFAEWAYNNTVDKENFSGLENKFTYKEYQDALDKFIKGKS